MTHLQQNCFVAKQLLRTEMIRLLLLGWAERDYKTRDKAENNKNITQLLKNNYETGQSNLLNTG